MSQAKKRAQFGAASTLAALAVVWAAARVPSDAAAPPAAYDETWPEDAEVALLVDVADDLDDAERAELLAELPAPPALNSEHSVAEGLYRLVLPRSAARALDERLDTDPRVETSEAEQLYETMATANDPLYPFQWNFEQIGIEPGWNRAWGEGVVVAVIDTGVAYAADDRAGLRPVRDLARFADGYDFVDDTTRALDWHGHGTHVAGTVAQTTNNEYGVAGVAPGVRIMPLRVLDRYGRGRTGDIADAIRFAADHGAAVINMSLGGPFPSRIMADAIAYAHERGVVVVAAAGNSASARPSYPAGYPHVISVAATQYDRRLAPYSNYGDSVDLAAPGGNTRVDQNGDGRPDGVMQETLRPGSLAEHDFVLFQGTSMASPHVAGAAALLVGMGITQPDRVGEILRASADSAFDGYERGRHGAGILDTAAATTFPLLRYQAPRLLLAGVVLLWLLTLAAGATDGTLGPRSLSRLAALVAATFAASGLAIPLWAASEAGVQVSALAPLATSPLQWPTGLGLTWLSHNFLWLSAAPVIALYAVGGAAQRRLTAGLLVGLMAGLGAYLVGEAVVPLQDVLGLPGAGALDRVWLGANGAIALSMAYAAAR
jgi:serine protease